MAQHALPWSLPRPAPAPGCPGSPPGAPQVTRVAAQARPRPRVAGLHFSWRPGSLVSKTVLYNTVVKSPLNQHHTASCPCTPALPVRIIGPCPGTVVAALPGTGAPSTAHRSRPRRPLQARKCLGSGGGGPLPAGPGPGGDKTDQPARDGPVSIPDLAAELSDLKGALTGLIAAAARVTSAVDAIASVLQQAGTSGAGGTPVPSGTVEEVTAAATAGAAAAGAGASWEGSRKPAPGAAAAILGIESELAVRLQQAFVQARVEGLGRPSEVALGDFVDVCLEAESSGVPLRDLQLQLILAQGALPTPFRRTQPPDTEPEGAPTPDSEAEEMRVRTLWVRFVYTTLATVRRIKDGLGYEDVVAPDDAGPPDPMDGFVQQTVKDAIDNGHDLHYVLAQQSANLPVPSPFIRMMRQSQVLILMALKKGFSS